LFAKQCFLGAFPSAAGAEYTYAHHVSIFKTNPVILLITIRFVIALWASMTAGALWADEFLEVRHTEVLNGQSVSIQGHLRKSSTNTTTERLPAVLLIHSAGGWTDGTTAPLARLLNESGFHTFELRFFPTNKELAEQHLQVPRTYAALSFLAGLSYVDAEKIGVSGFSLGAHLSIWTNSQILTNKFGGGRKFAAHAPVYPVCWLQSQLLRGQMGGAGRRFGLPNDFMSSFTGMPVKIFAAGMDDYDDRDPKACEDFVNQIPKESRHAYQVHTYLDATHGWNQKTRSFFEHIACKGKGCTNHNVFNPVVTNESNAAIVHFFIKNLKK
jgi:dienelactone hydrolase